MPKRAIWDLSHEGSLAHSIEMAFLDAAPRYGVTLAGIEDDANETGEFWRMVARAFIASNFADAPRERPSGLPSEGGPTP